MVKIVKGGQVLQVTSGAYKSIYKKQGYILFNPEDQPKVNDNIDPNEEDFKAPVDDSNDEPNTEHEINELLEKPISGWSKDDCKKYVSLTGLDLGGAKKPDEIKEKIKAHIEVNQ